MTENVLRGDYLVGRNRRQMVRVRIASLLAGGVAERIHDPGADDALGCGDLELVEAALKVAPPLGASFVPDDVCDAYVERLRGEVDAFLRREWPAVMAVAEELLRRGTLSGDEVWRLVAGSLSPPEAARLERPRTWDIAVLPPGL